MVWCEQRLVLPSLRNNRDGGANRYHLFLFSSKIRNMFKRFVHYYKKYKLIFALDMLAAFFIAVIGIGYPIITRLMLSDWIPNNELKLIIIGGVTYMTSSGDAGKVKKAKDTILYGVIGLVVVALAYAIVNFVITGIINKS